MISRREEGAAIVKAALETNISCGVEDHKPRCLESNAFDAIDALMAAGWRVPTGEKD